jgi:hypothetical protein
MALTKVIGDGLGGTNDLTVDTTTLTVDATNNRVGVGSATPLNALHIEGSNAADIFLKRADLTNKAWLFNVQSSTGDLNIKSRNDDGSASTTSMIIAHDGYVTKPLQPAFNAKPASNQDNLSNGTKLLYATERFDLGSNFASNTFTAPVTGKYQFNIMAGLLNIDAAAAYIGLYLATSNATYYMLGIDPDFQQDQAYWHMDFSVLADMDASDTAAVYWLQNGGANQTDLYHEASFFSGYLVC